MKRPLTYAKLQLEGGVMSEDSTTWCTCQKCGVDFHVDAEKEPCAFCNDCTNVVLDIFAKVLIDHAGKQAAP